jgi:hypothetical protein
VPLDHDASASCFKCGVDTTIDAARKPLDAHPTRVLPVRLSTANYPRLFAL